MVKENYKNVKDASGEVTVFSIPDSRKDLLENPSILKITNAGFLPKVKSNLITNQFTQYSAGKSAELPEYAITHIYGQHGSSANFPPGTGPFFDVFKTNTVADLDSDPQIDYTEFPLNKAGAKSVRTESGQVVYTRNVLNIIGILDKNDGKVYVGVGLVCKTSSEELLLAQTTTVGYEKVPGQALVVFWDISFQNGDQ